MLESGAAALVQIQVKTRPDAINVCGPAPLICPKPVRWLSTCIPKEPDSYMRDLSHW